MEVFRRVGEMPGAIDGVMGVIGTPPITKRAYLSPIMAP